MNKMPTLSIGYRRAERFVAEQRSLGKDVFWDGWTMVFFRPSESARKSKAGIYRNGQWGFANRVEVNSEGVWEVDFRNVKKRRRTARA